MAKMINLFLIIKTINKIFQKDKKFILKKKKSFFILNK
jgi:hypothetical protein